MHRARRVGRNGGILSYSAIWFITARHSGERLGLHVAPRDVRDAAATIWALAAPAQIGIARDLLAHADLRSTTKHYNRARGIEASGAYAKIIRSRTWHPSCLPDRLDKGWEG